MPELILVDDEDSSNIPGLVLADDEDDLDMPELVPMSDDDDMESWTDLIPVDDEGPEALPESVTIDDNELEDANNLGAHTFLERMNALLVKCQPFPGDDTVMSPFHPTREPQFLISLQEFDLIEIYD